MKDFGQRLLAAMADSTPAFTPIGPGDRVMHKTLTHFGIGTVVEPPEHKSCACSFVQWDRLPAGVPDDGEPYGHATKNLVKVFPGAAQADLDAVQP